MADTVETLTSGSSWVVPAGCTSVLVECIGAGGGGSTAASAGTAVAGHGGAGGSYAKKNFASVTPGATISYSIGAGAAGTVGGDTWFKSNDANGCVAKGGAAATGYYYFSKSGSEGIGSSSGCIGDVVFAGGNGSASTGNSGGGSGGGGAGATGAGGNASGYTPGTGNSPGGNGGAGSTAYAVGADGSNYGGGGAGGHQTSYTPRNGGAGGPGVIRLTYSTQTYQPVTDTSTTTESAGLTTSGADLAAAADLATTEQRYWPDEDTATFTESAMVSIFADPDLSQTLDNATGQAPTQKDVDDIFFDDELAQIATAGTDEAEFEDLADKIIGDNVAATDAGVFDEFASIASLVGPALDSVAFEDSASVLVYSADTLTGYEYASLRVNGQILGDRVFRIPPEVRSYLVAKESRTAYTQKENRRYDR